MNFYLVERNGDNVGWDEYDKLVVRAIDEKRALVVAREYWYDFNEEDVAVKLIDFDGGEGVVLGSFIAG